MNSAFRTVHKCTKHFKDIPGCFDVATEIKKQIEDFKPFIPLIQGLRNQGMRNRHWEQVCVHVYVYVYLYVRMYVCTYVCLYVCRYIVCAYVMHSCMNVCVCMFSYVYIFLSFTCVIYMLIQIHSCMYYSCLKS